MYLSHLSTAQSTISKLLTKWCSQRIIFVALMLIFKLSELLILFLSSNSKLIVITLFRLFRLILGGTWMPNKSTAKIYIPFYNLLLMSRGKTIPIVNSFRNMMVYIMLYEMDIWIFWILQAWNKTTYCVYMYFTWKLSFQQAFHYYTT